MSRPKQKYGVIRLTIDFLLVLVTGGLWLIWIIVRFLRNNS